MSRSVRMLANFIRVMWRSNYVIRSMVVRDLKARYTGSLMGIFWSVIHPLTQILLYFFVFSMLLKVRPGPEYGGTSFGFWMIAGLLPWMFFSEVVTGAPSAVVNQANLVKKTVFPSEIFPIVNLSAAVVNHLIALFLFMVFILLSGYGVSLKVFWLIPYLLTVCIFGLGIAWMLSSLNVFVRDVGHLTGVMVNIWFYLTPIIYPRSLVPASLQWVFDLNPVIQVVEGYRAAILGKTEVDIWGYGYLLVVATGIIVIGGLVFRKLKPAFAEVL